MGNTAPVIVFKGGDPLHRERESWSYGGGQDAADAAASRLDSRDDEWDRGLLNGRPADMSRADADRARGLQARGEEMYGAGAAMQMARGGGPSVAGAELSAARDAGLQQQAAMMAGGNQYAAMGQGAQYGAGLVGAYGQGRGAEMGQALQTYQGGMGAARGADYGQAEMDFARQRGLSDLYHGQRNLNDEMSEFYRRKAHGARVFQMDAMAKGHEIGRGQMLTKYAASTRLTNENAQRNAAAAQAGASIFSSMASAGMKS